MKEIQLTQGKVALVDDEDFEHLNQFKWNAHKRGCGYYAERRVTIDGKSKTIIMHNVIMNTPKGFFVDHIFHNTLDNRKAKLRLSTRAENNCNRRSAKNSSSKYLGVGFEKDRGWTARIRKDGIGYRLGTFKTENEAAIAYNKKAIELHKNFANLNIILWK